MRENNSILAKLVEEDFGINFDSKDYARSVEHDSLVVDMKHDIFHWNSRDLHGTPYIYLTQVRKLSHPQAKEVLKHYSNWVDTFIHEVRGADEVIVYPALVDAFHAELWQDDREYLHNRTITDETISRLKLGKYKNFYTIPIYSDGVLKNIQLRKDDPKVIKFYYKYSPVIFNGDILKWTNYIYIVEGTTSCIVMNQNGLPCISPANGADGFMEVFIPQFIHQKKIIILYDNDKAGMLGSLRVAKILGENRTKIYNFSGFDEHFDANDWFIGGGTKDELIELVEQRSKYAFQFPKLALDKK